MTPVVVDASVALKWYLTDEQYGEKALSLLKDHVAGGTGLWAPALLPFEVMNALVISQRRGRIDPEQVVLAMQGFFSLGITLVDMVAYYERINHFSCLYQRSVYDASYLALAEMKNCRFVTADERLLRSVSQGCDWVVGIGEV